MGVKASAEMLRRKQANCTGEKAMSAFLIRMKEHPQIKLRMVKRIQDEFSILFSDIMKEQSKAQF